MLELSFIAVVAAFFAGVLMFFAPCTLPLVPAFLAYLAGTDEATVMRTQARHRLLTQTLAYCAGFSSVFVALGIIAGSLGNLLQPLQTILAQLGGAFLIMVGVYLLGWFSWVPWRIAFHHQLRTVTDNPRIAFGIGAVFAVSWTPCIGPLLASVLLLVGSEGGALTGAILLSVFSLGLALPFVVCALALATVQERLQRYQKQLQRVNNFAGVILVVVGALLLTNQLSWVVSMGYEVFALLGLDWFYQYF